MGKLLLFKYKIWSVGFDTERLKQHTGCESMSV